MLHAMPAQHRDELDPDIARLLQLRDATDAPPVQTMTPIEARAWADRMFGPPERAWSVPHIEDRSIPGPDGDLRVRLYHPAPGRTRPLVIFFHGGGWVLSSVDSYDAVARRLCLEADAAVVSVEYRLAPEHPFPAAPDDAIAATRHILDHATAFGGDPARVAVAGDSAGGHLAAVAALGVRDHPGASLALQYLVYPIVDDDVTRESMRANGTGRVLETAGMTWFWQLFCPDAKDREDWRARPLHAASFRDLPPALVTLAAHDPLFDEGLEYARRLEDAGVQTTVRIARDLIHGYVSLEDASPRCHARTSEDHRTFAALLHGHG